MFAMLMDNTITTDASAMIVIKARVLKEVPGWDILVKQFIGTKDDLPCNFAWTINLCIKKHNDAEAVLKHLYSQGILNEFEAFVSNHRFPTREQIDSARERTGLKSQKEKIKE
jgi:hypothetical protein